MANHRARANTDFFDTQRNAHRVFRTGRKTYHFNPFRHIPWVSDKSKDVEALRLDPEFRTCKMGNWWKVTYLAPEESFTPSNQFKRTVLTSWINALLVCVPVGLCLHYVMGNSLPTFTVNFVAEIPLWYLCDYALEEMEKYMGPIASDLLDVFTNNTVQVISSFLLLKANQVSVLQTSLVGAILSNILVLLGLSLLSGGVSNHEQHFNRAGAQGSSSLLSIAATSLLIPTAVKQLDQTTKNNLVLQSRGVAVVLLFVYVTYTFYQMVTHRLDLTDQKDAIDSPHSQGIHIMEGRLSDGHRTVKSSAATAISAKTVLPAIESVMCQDGCCLPESIGAQKLHRNNNEILGPQLAFSVATFMFAVTIVLLYLCISATVDSLSAVTEQAGLSSTFVGLVLLPIPNCDFAPISLAFDNQLEQTMKYTVGRSIQIALLVEPLVVLMAWGMGVGGVTLAFDGFEVVSLFTTILLLNFLVVDAKVHWVHGVLLLADWVLIGIAAFFVSAEPLN